MIYVDLFAGIGGFRLALDELGHKCAAFCEIDKFARKSYKAIHNTKGEEEFHDITAVSDESIRGLGRVDIISGGFPCQAFSIAGKRRGFEDTRGTLFFEIARFASILRPRYLFLENVKGLLNHEGGATFETILRALDELGYDVEWEVLNSKNFGVPQNRERLFIIGHLRGSGGRKVFPIGFDGQKSSVSDFATGTLTTRYPESQREGTYVEVSEERRKAHVVSRMGSGEERDMNIREIAKIRPNRHSSLMNSILDPGGISPTLDTMNGGGREPKIRIKDNTKLGYAEAEAGDSVNLAHPTSKTRRGRVGKGVANTLLTGESQGVVIPVIKPTRGETQQNGRRIKEDGDDMFTLTAQDTHGVLLGKEVINPLKDKTDNGWHFEQQVYDDEGIARTLKAGGGSGNIPKVINELRIRKLTPLECWRLQGFPDWAFEKAAKVNSNSQLYKQAGNSVTVPVIYEIAKRLI